MRGRHLDKEVRLLSHHPVLTCPVLLLEALLPVQLCGQGNGGKLIIFLVRVQAGERSSICQHSRSVEVIVVAKVKLRVGWKQFHFPEGWSAGPPS